MSDIFQIQILLKYYNPFSKALATKMLKFLENRSDSKIQRKPMNFKPEMVYGISIEAPESFQNPHTLVKQDTYLNKHIPFEQNRQKKLSDVHVQQLRKKWAEKINLSRIKKHNFSYGGQENEQNLKQSSKERCENIKNGLSKNPSLYCIKSGYFTDFMDRNKFYKVIGPLHGNQRAQSQTQHSNKSSFISKNKAIILENNNKTIRITQQSEQLSQGFNSTAKSKFSVGKRSRKSNKKSFGGGFDEKLKIEQSRKTLKKSFMENIEKNREKNLMKFHKNKKLPIISPFYKSISERQKTTNEKMNEDGLQDLESFEDKLLIKFK